MCLRDIINGYKLGYKAHRNALYSKAQITTGSTLFARNSPANGTKH